MEVLSRKEYADIIAWTPSGKAFNVINPKEFTAGILPTHFKSAKYSSFTRKLHRWGFIRHYRGEEAGAFHHKYFQKDRLELVEKMTCFKEGDKPGASPKREEKTENLAARPTPMATMEAHPSLIADVLPPLPSRFLSSRSGWPVNPSIQQSGLMSAPSDLNAAIEMEVSRRLKERVSAAAMSREALAMMQHQMKPPSSYTDQRYLALLQQGGVPSRLIGNNLIDSFKKELAMTQHFNATAANFAAMNVSSDQRQRLNSMPATNIKIAKTA
jgi:hypothetical protein